MTSPLWAPAKLAMASTQATPDAAGAITVAEAAEPSRPIRPDGDRVTTKPKARSVTPVEPVSVSPVPTHREEAVRAAKAERLQDVSALPEITYPPAAPQRPPTWVAEPTEDEIARVYPIDAFEDGMSGSVLLSCRERLDGTVDRCQVLEETPSDAGFGRAAVKLSRNFRLTPFTIDGRLAETIIEIPYEFAVED